MTWAARQAHNVRKNPILTQRFFGRWASFKKSRTQIVSEYIGNAIDFSLVEFNQDPLSNSLALVYKERCPPDEIAFKESLLKAKKARFEHGESG